MEKYIDLDDAQKLHDLSNAKNAEELTLLKSYFDEIEFEGVRATPVMYQRTEDRIELMLTIEAYVDEEGCSVDNYRLEAVYKNGEWSALKAHYCERWVFELVNVTLELFWKQVQNDSRKD